MMDHQEIKGNQDHLDHQGTGVLLVSLDQLDLLEPEDQWEHKENVVILESPAKKVRQDPQAFKAPMGQWVPEERGEKRDPWENLAHLGCQVDQVTRVHLEQLVAWGLLEDLDCL